jgi:Holliday junction resolvase RusA-like endonuclease
MYLLQQKKIKFDFSKPFMIDIKLNKDSIELNFRRCKGIKNIRGDVDNHIKGILDALQKAYNFNDKNCYAVSCVAYDARG